MTRAALLLIACALAGAFAANDLRANDSVAAAEAGGLVLRQSRDIDMVSEDLYVSRLEIRVRYVFRNRSARPVRTIVAFPMPDRDLAVEEGGEVAWPSSFRTRVGGREIAMRVERRVLARGVDHTALLARLRVPILSRPDESRTYQALDRLPRAAQDQLVRLGLIALDEERGTGRFTATALWTAKETWYWEQTFPPGRDLVVEHRYRPGLGGSAGTGLASREMRESNYGREMIARYCVDNDFIAAVERIASRNDQGIPPLSEDWLSYVLTTGANWRAPIGDFRLVVDKGDPRFLVSFCGEGIRRLSPTQFEIRHRNWRPTRDLNVLFLHPQ